MPVLCYLRHMEHATQAMQRNRQVARLGEAASRRQAPLLPLPSAPGGITPDGATLKLRGLPYSAGIDDITSWLAGECCLVCMQPEAPLSTVACSLAWPWCSEPCVKPSHDELCQLHAPCMQRSDTPQYLNVELLSY